MGKYSNTICLILVVAASLLLISACSSKTFKKNHTAETGARITSIGTGCGSSRTVVEFVYTVNGKNLENWTCYHHTSDMRSGFKVNGQATACYDPSDPKDSSVIPKGYRCGQ